MKAFVVGMILMVAVTLVAAFGLGGLSASSADKFSVDRSVRL